jgi:hypothetical protein
MKWEWKDVTSCIIMTPLANLLSDFDTTSSRRRLRKERTRENDPTTTVDQLQHAVTEQSKNPFTSLTFLVD